MACPLPSEFQSLVPVDVENPTCDEIIRILTEWTNLVADNAECMFNEDLTLNAEFAEKVCNINCP